MEANKRVHLNCDLGEGAAFDALIMPLIDACNIAAGGHIGDENTIRKTIDLAQNNKVEIGIHPSYPDRLNFGRKPINISEKELGASLLAQWKLFDKIAKEQGASINHIKLHGALYNDCSKNLELAHIIVDLIINHTPIKNIYCPPSSSLSIVSKGKLNIVYEGFADRKYENDVTLISRKLPHAMITNKEEAWKQIESVMDTQRIKCHSGELMKFECDTFCIHGDNPYALEMLRFFKSKLNSV